MIEYFLEVLLKSLYFREMNWERSSVAVLIKALREKTQVFQVLVGPRQVGKTTVAKAVSQKIGWPTVYASADTPLPPGPEWIETQWRLASVKRRESNQPVLLILDEIQKVQGWSETLKFLWDSEESRESLRLLILGSSALLIQSGLSESLAGRFFLRRCAHWSWKECSEAFGWDLNTWLFYGGYPGSVPFVEEEEAWKSYVQESLVETVVSRDVLQMETVGKPILLRQLFALAAAFPAQIFSYNKMLGQLQDAGNTTTLAHYLHLLEKANLVSGLTLFSRGHVRKRGSSPKLILWNNALISAFSLLSFSEMLADSAKWGRLVENAVGAHFLNHLTADWLLTYWRQGNQEVDFILTQGDKIWAIEVKSGRSGKLSGCEAFRKKYPKAKFLLIGTSGIPVEEFFSQSPLVWFV